MNTSNFFGLIAGLTLLVGYILYLKQTTQNQSTPNLSSWAIWLLVGIINSITYFSITENNLWQSLPGITSSCFELMIFTYSLFKGNFSKITKVEIIAFTLAIIIVVFWQITSNDRISNLFLQLIYIIALIPTINAIIKGTAKEYPMAWIVVIVSQIFLLISIGIDPHIDWIAFVSPIIVGILGNAIVVGSIVYKRHKK